MELTTMTKLATDVGVPIFITVVSVLAVWKGGGKIIGILSDFLKEMISEFKEINSNMGNQNKNMETALSNISVSLEIIRNQTGDISEKLSMHDERAEVIHQKVNEICIRSENCGYKLNNVNKNRINSNIEVV